jgi:small subunit ribosomal protein S21
VQIVRRGLACPSIGDNVESDLLSLVEDTHASAFDRADVHEDILAAIIRLNEAEAFLVVEPLHGPFCHIALLFRYVCNVAARQRSRFVRDLEKSRQSRRGMRGEAKSFGRSSIAAIWAIFSWTARLPGKSLEKKGWLFDRPVPMLGVAYAIWDHHHQQYEATRRTACLSTDIRPGNTGRMCSASKSRPYSSQEPPEHNPMQVLVRDNNIDQALRVLKKKMQREGVFREMKRRRFYEKPSEQAAREKSEAARRARKLARKQAIRDGLIAAPKKKLAPLRKGAAAPPPRANP